MRRLALFDLDHTLLPIDSDYEWGRFLGSIGAVDAESYDRTNSHFYEQYKAGTLVIEEFLAFSLAPLAANDAATLAGWQARFMTEVIAPIVRPEALALVASHRARSDLCAIVTATNDFVTAPIARLFDVENLIATRSEVIGDRHTGKALGVPSFREGKIERTDEWLESLSMRWSDFGETFFYSDSMNDLPLLERASQPIATNPDPRLRLLAKDRGWRVLDLFQ